ncbi:MAG TPA: DNRLRE domain-containing protein [Candidatus Paceibacterota bacterium]|nr:DNRLRE domain-containing protein [Verrucomicrobiota bacterium]HSA10943.1 DNRLRE domain-containing protein [Candidatus Paceibacterota bacterium]
MNIRTQALNARPATGATIGLACGRAFTILLTVAILAALGITTSALADRVGHDVAAGQVQVTGLANASTFMTVLVGVNQFGITNNGNIADHKIAIGPTNQFLTPPYSEDNDVAGGVLIGAVAQNERQDYTTNCTHTMCVNPTLKSGQAYEIAPAAIRIGSAAGVASGEQNVNFGAAWFPYNTWLGGYARNSTGANGGVNDTFTGSSSLVLGTHFIDWKTAYALNGRAYVDLRPFGIDSRRDGVLLVNHAKNEANYAVSQVNNADDEWDGTWTIQVRDNRSDNLEQDPIVFVFVPKSNTNVVSGMFTADASITMHSGATPAFTVTNFTDGQYLLKVPGRSPDDGVLIISGACGGGFNGDNVVTYEPNAARDGWIIQTRDLPACNNGQQMDDTDVVCSFAFIPAEKPGVTVTPNKNLLTTEAGGTAQFTVRVNGYPKPTADVTINLASSDTSEGTVDLATLTFTPAEWDVAKTVTVTGVDDGAVDGSQAYTINLTATSSTDPNYNGLVPGNVQVINIDNEAGVALDKTGVTTAEPNGTDTFTVWLTVAPTADVTLSLSSSDTTEATVSPASLTFTPLDYGTPQVVTVTGVDDWVQDGNIAYSIVTGAASSADPAYNNFDALDVAGVNLDNDLAKVIVPASKFTVTEPNTTANISVVLNSEPTADVTINCVSTDTTEGTAAGVTFTPLNWNTPQNIVLTAADDLVNDGTIAYSIATTVTSADPVYAAIDPDDVAAETIDNEIQVALPSGNFIYGIGEPATGIDGYATLSDVDSADYNGGGLTVTITAGGNSNDRLAVRNDGMGVGQIGVSGNNVTYEGATIGTWSGGTGTTPLSVTFNSAAATPAAVQALVRAVTYQNVDAGAAPGTRTLSFVLADGASGVSTASKTIIVRLMRIYSFQQDADGGFGPYYGAADCQTVFDDPDTPYPMGQNNGGTRLWIDWNTAALLPEDQSQCLLRFTNIFGAGLGQIPPGAKIVFAELTLNVEDSGHGALFNRMLVDWDSDGATWNYFKDLSYPGDPGGIQLDDTNAVSQVTAFLMDSANNTTSGTGLRTIGVTTDIQAWQNGANNYGWVMSPRTNGSNGTAYSPCEHANILLRPRLRVGWVPASVAAASFQEGTDGYTGTVDTQVRLVAPDTSYAGNATLSPDPLVNAAPVPNPNHVLLRFDNIFGTGAGKVTPGSKVHVAVLELTSINADAQGAGGQFHHVLKPWNDADTWNTWVNGVQTDGVEAAVSPTVTIPVEGFGVSVQPTRHHIEITADVQAWASGTLANNGWAIMPWDEGSNGWAFNSANNATVNTRPLLRVYYDPAPAIVGAVHNGTSVDLTVSGTVGKTYHVVRTGDLTVPTASWTVLSGTVTIGSGGTGVFTDNSLLPGNANAFYRVREP